MTDGVNTNEGSLQKSIRSGKWFMISVVAQKLLNLVSFFVLVRLLSPKDYGILTVALLFSGVIDRFAAPGFSIALIQRKESPEKMIDTVWTFDLLRATLLAVIIFLLGGVIAEIFKIEESYKILIKMSGFFFVIGSFSNSRQLYFFRDLDYKKIFFRDLAGQIANTIVSVAWAIFVSSTVWALFIGQVSRHIVGAVSTYVLYPTAPRFSFRFRDLLGLVGYSKWVYGQNLLEYFLGAIDSMIVGRWLGPTNLGYYTRARDLPSMFSANLTGILNKIGFSAYAKVQDKRDKIQEGFLKSLDLILLSTIPFSLLLLVEGGFIVSVLFGQKWLPIVVPLKILSVYGVFFGLTGMIRPIFGAIGRPDLNFKSNLFQLLISVPIYFLGIKIAGVNGIAASAVLIAAILLIYVLIQARSFLRLLEDRVFYSIFGVVTASLCSFLVVFLFRDFIHSLSSKPLLAAWIIFLAFFYLFILWLFTFVFKKGPWLTLRLVIKEIVRG